MNEFEPTAETAHDLLAFALLGERITSMQGRGARTGVARRLSHVRLAVAPGLAALFCVALAQDAPAQDIVDATPQSRREAIDKERAEKLAELWPERQNAIVDLANGYAERGLKEGLDSGKGSNGLQFPLGGMRAAQGMSFGVGYRRSDFVRDHFGFRATARGTLQGAYMFDFSAGLQGTRADRTSLQWYTKYEHSPDIDFYGIGNDTTDSRRASYLFDDLSSDFKIGRAHV